MAIAPLALAVQGNHEHRDVIVGYLPFPCGAVVLPLCAVYQHLGQLREPVGTILQMYSGARAKSQGQPSENSLYWARHLGTQAMQSNCGAR